MKRFVICYFVLCTFIVANAQNESIHFGHNPAHFPVPEKWKIPYALLSDSTLRNQDDMFVSNFVIYPTLMLNGILIEDCNTVDRFRNNYDPKMIRFKVISYKKASKKGIICSEDGLLIVKTKRRYFIVL